MDLKSRNRLQWVLSGALGASIALAPALAASGQQTTQQTPTPGQQGDWGQAGPPPDVQNGQIPPPDSAAQDQNQNADQGPPQYPGQTADQNQDPNQPPPPPPPAASGPGVGYGQPPRPAYQPARTKPMRTRVRRVRPRRLLPPARSRCRTACSCRFAPVSRWIRKK